MSSNFGARQLRLILAGFCLFLVLLAAAAWGLSLGPDREVVFVREAHSRLSPGQVGEAFTELSYFPRWHHFGVDARFAAGAPKRLAVGSRLELVFWPKKQKWREFVLTVELTRYEPGKAIAFRLLEDSKGKIRRLFETLEWVIELEPEGEGTLIRGTIRGRTDGARSRLLSRVASPIVMHQVLYVDLHMLREWRKPTPEEQSLTLPTN